MKGTKELLKFDHSKLLGKIKECGLTQEKLANAINISPFTLNKKILNKSSFDADEMVAIGNTLGFSASEFDEYFFVEMV